MKQPVTNFEFLKAPSPEMAVEYSEQLYDLIDSKMQSPGPDSVVVHQPSRLGQQFMGEFPQTLFLQSKNGTGLHFGKASNIESAPPLATFFGEDQQVQQDIDTDLKVVANGRFLAGYNFLSLFFVQDSSVNSETIRPEFTLVNDNLGNEVRPVNRIGEYVTLLLATEKIIYGSASRGTAIQYNLFQAQVAAFETLLNSRHDQPKPLGVRQRIRRALTTPTRPRNT